MEYNWTVFRNNSSGASYGVRGHNGHSTTNPTAWETITPSSEHLLAARNPDPSLTVLKLGKRHYFHHQEEDAAGRPPKNGKACSAAPSCQVEGCDSVLLTAKEYHRRHKVCEAHAKAPRVLLLGIQQRFCQQCSRFHELSEFDESKRSCRKRLAGHNLRRRKTSQEQHSLGRQPHSLNTRECALSLLSSSTNYHPCWAISPSSDDLPARCSAALRELIAENRAYISAHRQLYHIDECSNNTNYKHGLSREAGHVTLDLMQDPGSAFGLLSVHGHKAPKEGNASEIWRLPLGY